ncbi:MAG: quinolinate synthase NadA [Kiritimatiellae bacterium]|nr:quinolinate synthase NadA [Kiritimatiellia bacterium]
MDILAEIARLKAERNALILAHNYQRPEVQDIADFTGDSLELARKASGIDAPVVVFCGVHFMAETAAILNPDKRILSPDPTAGCPMADMIDAAQLREFKAAHPGAATVCYVNSTAEVKAESDCCCTSGNAEKILAHYEGREVLFVPDQHLGSVVAERLGREVIVWPGYCPTHARIRPEDILELKAAHPGAVAMTHPECAKPVRDAADEVLSTGQMCAFAKKSAAKEFIVATEEGILHRLRQENPDKVFYPVSPWAICPNMKKTTLEKVYFCLRDNAPAVEVDPAIAVRARRAIDQMLAWS